ncbi:hypothetical protein CFBP4996_26555 (plasmid) [Agrobacterium leguminum]|uniref:hypothetical protein n=1 Tax=Agrobacterium leguminum TaxID=2792015 RepID=UPI0010C9D506|nr:hypothetical protein [Agrobacterium leguminum]WFS69556.1 hypothetical protein CFBP4996_26555 [Agrobacterium leguminum]
MFGLFKKNEPAGPDRIVRLLEIFETLSAHADGLYSDVDRYNPAEVRFFTMSAISVDIQNYGGLDEKAMQQLVGKFIEQAIASLLFKMPRASYDLLHNAFAARFGEYADLIVDLSNSQTGEALQSAIYGLMTVLDRNARVERDDAARMLQGLKIVTPLTNAAGDVADVFRGR